MNEFVASLSNMHAQIVSLLLDVQSLIRGPEAIQQCPITSSSLGQEAPLREMKTYQLIIIPFSVPSPIGNSPTPRSSAQAEMSNIQELGQSHEDTMNWIPFPPLWMCRVEQNNLYQVEQVKDTDSP